MVNTANQPSYSTIPILNNDIEPIVVSTRRRNKVCGSNSLQQQQLWYNKDSPCIHQYIQLSRILTATVLFAVASVLIVAVVAQVTRSKPGIVAALYKVMAID